MLQKLVTVAGVLVLCAPACAITVLSPNDPSLQGTVIASQTVPIFSYFQSTSPDPVFMVDEKVVQNTTGTLDFYYKVIDPSDQPTTLKDFGFDFPQGNSLQLTPGYLDEGNLAPTSAAVSTIGTTGVNFHFGTSDELVGVPLANAGTDWLLLRTNASAYTIGSVGAARGQDDQILPATGYVPDASSVPEPRALALLPAGLLGLAVKFRRQCCRVDPLRF